MAATNEQYDGEVKTCRDIFLQKTRDYGTSWRVLRMISIADQLYIKAKRIRTLQETRESKVGEDKAGEFRAMVNYGVIGLSQESFADLILMKLLRIRQILANDGKTLISEGIDSNFIDIINYSLFALILIREGKHTS
jgi:hypothetical protein